MEEDQIEKPVKLTEGQAWQRFANKQISRLRHDWRQSEFKEWWCWLNKDVNDESVMPSDWPTDRIGRDPLMAAVLLKKDSHLKMLLKRDECSINRKDQSSHSALHYAAGLDFDLIAHILLDAGADETIKTVAKKTPGKIATIVGNIKMADELGENTDSVGIHTQNITSEWTKKTAKGSNKKNKETQLPWLIEKVDVIGALEECEDIGLFSDNAHLSPHEKDRHKAGRRSNNKRQHFIADFSGKEYRQPKVYSEVKIVSEEKIVGYQQNQQVRDAATNTNKVEIIYKKSRRLK
jgi:hypothetical protein